MSKEEIFARVVQMLEETFELEAAGIRPESRLYEELNLDSIDAVDLLVKLKPIVGAVQPELFKSARTVQDVVDALHTMAHTVSQKAS